MSSLNKVLFKTCNITPEQEVKYTKGQAGDSNQSQLNAESIVDKITEINYFEDILSPAVTCYLRVSDTTNVISRLPLRGYERVDLAVQTDNGWFEFTSGEGRGAVSYTHLTLPTIYSV